MTGKKLIKKTWRETGATMRHHEAILATIERLSRIIKIRKTGLTRMKKLLVLFRKRERVYQTIDPSDLEGESFPPLAAALVFVSLEIAEITGEDFNGETGMTPLTYECANEFIDEELEKLGLEDLDDDTLGPACKTP